MEYEFRKSRVECLIEIAVGLRRERRMAQMSGYDSNLESPLRRPLNKVTTKRTPKRHLHCKSRDTNNEPCN